MPVKGLEIALAYHGNAYRAVYTVQIGEDVWVVHAVQKKSTQGIKTPRREIDLTRIVSWLLSTGRAENA